MTSPVIPPFEHTTGITPLPTSLRVVTANNTFKPSKTLVIDYDETPPEFILSDTDIFIPQLAWPDVNREPHLNVTGRYSSTSQKQIGMEKLNDIISTYLGDLDKITQTRARKGDVNIKILKSLADQLGMPVAVKKAVLIENLRRYHRDITTKDVPVELSLP
jgi:hypothetical protein